MTRRRSSPATIRSNAADLSLRERALDLQERQVAIQEKNQVMLEDAAATERQRSYWRESEGIQDRARARTVAAEDRATTARDRAYQAGVTTEAQGKMDRTTAQMEDYQMAKAAIGSGQAGPVMEYFEKWGNAKMRIEDIQFGEGPHAPVQVTFNTAPDKPVTFQDAGQAFAMLLAPTSPQLAAATTKEKFKEREVSAKERKVAVEEGKGKTLSAKEEAELNRKISADVDKHMREGVGRPEEYTTDSEWRVALMEEKRREVLGSITQAAAAPVGAPGVEQPEVGIPTGQPQGGPGYREVRVRNKDTGEIGVKRIMPDGSTEIYDAKGKMIRRAWDVGAQTPRTYTPAGGELSAAGEVHTLPVPAEQQPARAEAVPTEAGPPGKGKTAVAYHTDEAGNKVASWVNAKGEVETRIVKKKKDEDEDGEDKDKKKKKKKEGVHD